VTRLLEPVDCPECGSAGAVDGDFCQVCYADVDARIAGADRLTEAVSASPAHSDAASVPGQPLLHPSIPPRFSNVIEELREIGTQALEAGTTQGWRIAAACRRAESLLFVLRRHFLQEVVLGDQPPSAIAGR
jgi:hypothetical protein